MLRALRRRALTYHRHVHLIPYQQVDGIPFDWTPADLLAARGAPRATRRNAVDLNEYDYGDWVCRFEDSGRLEEVTRRAPVLHLGALAVPFDRLAALVRAQDDDAFERAGFVVSPRWGIAFVPDAPCWVTALAAHGVAAWRAM